jgi:hypothetical protein
MRGNSLDFSIYPNPVQHTEGVTLGLVLNKETVLSYQIYDLLGKKVQQKQVAFFSVGEHSINIKVDDLPNGVWFIALQADNQIVRAKKFIVQR